jgi:hypothetical protein
MNGIYTPAVTWRTSGAHRHPAGSVPSQGTDTTFLAEYLPEAMMMNMTRTFAAMVALLAIEAPCFATTVFSDNFATSQGATFTTSGTIGTSDWNVTRSGADWGARIDSNLMTLTNDASATLNADGWVFSSVSTGDFSAPWNSTLASNPGVVTWSFNMRQIRTDPAGFTTNSYGVGFVLGGNSTTAATAGSGYAVVLGNTGATDPLRLVSFTGGLQSLGTASSGLILATAPLNDVGTSHMSIRVTYNPSNNAWEMFGRDDGASFQDPTTGTLTSLGNATNSAFTSVPLTSMGAYWQGSTAATQTALFDNVVVSVVPEPSTLALLGCGAIGLAVYAKRRRR